MTLRNVIGRDRIIFIGTGVTATGFILRSRLSYRVEIEEAAPDAAEFRRFVEEYLIDAGFGPVDVVTEW